MKNRDYFIIQNVAAIIVGMLLVMWPDSAMIYLVMTIGAIFSVSGILALVRYYRHRNIIGYNYPLIGTGSLLLGIWLLIMPAFFINFLMYIIGLAIIMAGANMLVNLNVASRWSIVSGYFYITPILIILAGMLVLVNPFTVATIQFIVLGISCMVYGIVNMINTIKFKKDPDKYEY